MRSTVFNDPLLIQYKNWLLEAMQFNFGTSYITGDPVAERIGPAFMNTLKLNNDFKCYGDDYINYFRCS